MIQLFAVIGPGLVRPGVLEEVEAALDLGNDAGVVDPFVTEGSEAEMGPSALGKLTDYGLFRRVGGLVFGDVLIE